MRKSVFFILQIFILYSLFFIPNYPVSAQSPTAYDPASIGKRVYNKQPKLLIAFPQEGTTIYGTSVTMKAIVDNMILVDPTRKKKPKKGEGHLHLWFDKNPEKDVAIEYFRNEEYIFESVPDGDHVLTVEVVKNNHSSFTPAIKHEIHFKTTTGQQLKEDILPIDAATQKTPLNLNRYTPQIIGAIAALLLISIGAFLWLYK